MPFDAEPQEAARRLLPRRDIWLLPLIGILTVLAMYGVTEGLLRVGWAQQDIDSCRAGNGLHRPGCQVAMKTAEGPWVQYEYNACGFRDPGPCGPPPAGTLSLAVVGSSLAGGAYVPYPQTFPARLAADLSQACGLPVAVHDVAGFVGAETEVAQQIGPALAQKPAAVILAMMPADLERFGDTAAAGGAAPGPPLLSLSGLKSMLNGSRVAQVGQYYVFGDLARYARLYLQGGKADFMRDPLTPVWQDRLAQWDAVVRPMAAQARAAGIPFILVFAPQRAQLALRGTPLPPNVDPDLLDRQLAAMADRDGILFVDLAKAWQGRDDQGALYYRLDGHPTAFGHGQISQVLDRTLLSGAVPALNQCHQS